MMKNVMEVPLWWLRMLYIECIKGVGLWSHEISRLALFTILAKNLSNKICAVGSEGATGHWQSETFLQLYHEKWEVSLHHFDRRQRSNQKCERRVIPQTEQKTLNDLLQQKEHDYCAFGTKKKFVNQVYGTWDNPPP